MRQNGWLDFAYGVWHLVLEDDDHPVRYWNDMGSALARTTIGNLSLVPGNANWPIRGFRGVRLVVSGYAVNQDLTVKKPNSRARLLLGRRFMRTSDSGKCC